MINLLNKVKKVAHFDFFTVIHICFIAIVWIAPFLKIQLLLSLFFDSYGKSSSE